MHFWQLQNKHRFVTYGEWYLINKLEQKSDKKEQLEAWESCKCHMQGFAKYIIDDMDGNDFIISSHSKKKVQISVNDNLKKYNMKKYVRLNEWL